MRETFSTTMDTTTNLAGRKGYFISRPTLAMFSAFLFCSYVAVAVIFYAIGDCQQQPHNACRSSVQVHSTDYVTAAVTTQQHSTGPPPHSTDFTVSELQSAPSNQPDENVDVRLPRAVVPIAYDIKLVPFLIENNFTFNGEVSILVRIVDDCQNITLHAAAITVHEVNVQRVEEQEQDDDDAEDPETDTIIDIVGKSADAVRQFFVIQTGTVLRKGSIYRIYIRYEGVLNDYLQGFYRSSYNVGSEQRWVATTQFQPTDCRRAFPSFDEPALKATFKLSIARPQNMISLSNMPKISSEPMLDPPNYVLDIYNESIPMSTYLVAFVISDFKSLSSGNFAVWARSDAIQSAKYALSVGTRVLKYFEKFFGIPYPLPKMDMIALPDFSSGAMENFGLITYRETAMLYEEGVSAAANKQRVAIVVSHELAHQWFGNLVTPSWWTDLWLNEGFASYMEYVGVDAVEPSWKSMDQFVVSEIHSVFSLDALSTSHPISIKVNNPDEINEIFDRISYAKGAAIIRMMDHFLTKPVFQTGLSNYLTKMAYQSAEQDDLWEYLTAAAREANIFDHTMFVKEIMDTWTLQMGFPVVTVTRNYTGRKFKLRQSRFILKDSLNETRETRDLWYIPITYTTSKYKNFETTQPMEWMRQEKEIEIEDESVAENDWLILNLQQTGYYRVNYDEQNWNLITKHLQNPLKYRDIAPTNRAQLMNDALNLAKGGYLSYKIALDVTRYLAHEEDYVPWKAAINSLGYIDSMLIKVGDYALFKEYYLHLLTSIYDYVGFNDHQNSSMLTIYKRVDILTAACQLGLKDCIDNCIRQFHMWIHEPNPDINNPISPNLKNVVYCMAIKYGDVMEWEFAWERYQRTTVSSEKEILLSAMGCSRETWILSRFLDRALNDKHGIRKQDVFRVFGAVANSVIGQPVAFNFIKQNWNKMKQYFGESMANLNTILKYTTKRLNTQFELDELKSFAKTHLNETGRTIHQAIERTEANIEWMNKNYNTIVDWLAERVEELAKNQIK